MNAAEVLQAIRRKHSDCAIVPEVSINVKDHGAWERYYDGQGERPSECRRIDALMFDGGQRTAIEIKVSVADAKRENWRKVAPWWEVTHRYVYAVPAGLIDTPPVIGAALWWVHPDGRIEVKRKASIRPYPEQLPQHVVIALAYRAAKTSRIKGQEAA